MQKRSRRCEDLQLDKGQQRRRLAVTWAVLTGASTVCWGKWVFHSNQHSLDHISILHPALCPSVQKTSVNWSKFRGGPLRWRGLEHLPSEEEPREQSLFSLEQRWFQGNQHHPPVTTGTSSRIWSQAFHSGSWWKDYKQWWKKKSLDCI